MANYVPPSQSKFSQFVDVVVLMLLTFGALYVPLLLKLAGGAKTPLPLDKAATWASLGQDTPEKIAAYKALGFTDPTNEALQNLITARYDYTVSALELAVMVVVVVGYFFLVIKFSGTEYADVIDEKFGEKK